LFSLGCPYAALAFTDYCVSFFPEANLDPSQLEAAQTFCKNKMIVDGQVLMNISGNKNFFFIFS